MRLVSGSKTLLRLSTLPLSTLPVHARGTVHHVLSGCGDRVERLLALGVTPGAPILVLQTAPGIVFRCDQTELAVEREVANVIFITPASTTPAEG